MSLLMASRVHGPLVVSSLLSLALLAPLGCREPAPSPRTGASRIAVGETGRAGHSLLASAAQDVDVPVMAPAPGDQGRQAMIFNGTNYFIVWTSIPDDTMADSCRVVGVHVSPAGQVLDDTQVVLSNSCPSSVAIGFDGASYLVVWDRYSWTGSREDIHGARVGVDGSLLEAEKVISAAGSRQQAPALVWGQDSYLMVWEDISGERRPGVLRAARVAADGTLIDTDFIGIPRSGGTYEQLPQVAFDGSNFLVAWNMNGNNRMLGARIAQDGQLIGGDAIPLDGCTLPVGESCGYGYHPSLSFGGGRFFVSWVQGVSDRVQAALVNPDGSLASSVLELSPAGVDALWSRTAFDGTCFWVAWTADVDGASQIHAARVTSDGSVLDAPGVSGNLVVTQRSSTDAAAALAASPAQAFATWVDERGPLATDLYGARMGGDGVLRDGTPEASGFAVARAANTQRHPTVASDGDGYLIAWADARDAKAWDIYAVHVDAAGNVLDSPPLLLGSGVSGAVGPAVAHSAGQYLVLWQDLGVSGPMQVGVTGALIEASGDVTAVPRLFGTTCTSLVVAPTEGGFRLHCGRGGLSYSTFYLGLVRSDGSVQDLGSSIVDNSQLQSLGVAYLGLHHVVTHYVHSGATFRYYRASASLFDPAGDGVWSGSLISDGYNYTFAPVASARPEGFLMVSRGDALYSSFVNLSGTVVHASAALRGFDPDQALPLVRAPVMAFDGAGHLLTWASSGASSAEIMAVRVSDDGQVTGAGVDNRGTLLGAEPGREAALRLAANQSGQLLLAYQLATGAPAVERARFRLLNPAPAGASCQTALDCASDHCVDGVCCDTACGGGASDDCQACGVEAGAQVDGTCAVIVQGHACRPVAGGCDVEELCDGVEEDCPEDLFAAASSTCSHGLGACDTGGTCTGSDGICHSVGVQAAGVECRAAAGPCDRAEQCDGANGACPADSRVWAGMQCRVSAGGCDPAEVCDGVDPDCPADALFEAIHACRPASGECDLAEACTGSAAECPADLRAADGTACTDGLCAQGSCDRSPLFVSQPTTGARCGEPYAYSAAGAPEMGGPGPFVFELLQAPDGMVVGYNTGALDWTPAASQVGSHAVSLQARNGYGSAVQSFSVEVTCGGSDGGSSDGGGVVGVDGGGGGHAGSGDAGGSGAAADGCGCRSSGEVERGAPLLGLLLLVVRRRR